MQNDNDTPAEIGAVLTIHARTTGRDILRFLADDSDGITRDDAIPCLEDSDGFWWSACVCAAPDSEGGAAGFLIEAEERDVKAADVLARYPNDARFEIHAANQRKWANDARKRAAEMVNE